MATVFVSYKSENETQALAFVKRLESMGIDCWIACRDIHLGTDYVDEIPQAIDDCHFFLLVLSENIDTSPWVKSELKQAISSGKFILPVMLEDFPLPKSYAFMLQNYQIFPFFNDSQAVFREIISSIYKAVPHLQHSAPTVYEGDKPYVYLSFSYKDKDRVFPIIQQLQDKGFRVWYDEGIEAGSEWTETIVNKLLNSHSMIAFVSSSYQNSHSCRGELTFALNRSLSVLPIFLEDTELSPGMQFQLSNRAVMSHTLYPNEEEFIDSLVDLAALKACQETSD